MKTYYTGELLLHNIGTEFIECCDIIRLVFMSPPLENKFASFSVTRQRARTSLTIQIRPISAFSISSNE